MIADYSSGSPACASCGGMHGTHFVGCSVSHSVSRSGRDGELAMLDRVARKWEELRRLHCSAMLVEHFQHWLDSGAPDV